MISTVVSASSAGRRLACGESSSPRAALPSWALVALLLLPCRCSPLDPLVAADAEGPEEEIRFQLSCTSDGDCEDGNPCTADSCLSAECSNEPAPGESCDDGNACTVGDQCSDQGLCLGTDALACDDGNPCTVDQCEATKGCTVAPRDEEMECDGSPCTAGDSCQEGVCIAGPPIACPDPDPGDCQFTSCDPKSGQCTVAHLQPPGYGCKDGNACTDDDLCDEQGVCQPGTSHLCDAQNPCKTAWCNEKAKEGTNPCVTEWVTVDTPCNDGSKCTDGDSCLSDGGTGLSCKGTPVDCDDGNSCTLDSCVEESGCLFEAKNNGTPCTLDNGAKGSCWQGICKEATENCDDGVGCTIDAAIPGGGCSHTPDHSWCDDKLSCNGTELCDQLQGCLPGQPAGCDDGIACTVDGCDLQGCFHTPNHSLCNDNNGCTDDQCLPLSGCLLTNNQLPCDDGNACTLSDSCSLGACSGGPQANCDDGDPCTQDSCNQLTGCVHTGGNCGAPCTPYAVTSCYSGPGGTAGVGSCKNGFRQCTDDGLGWSPCYGEVLPASEDICGNAADDDCDGTQADENCAGQPSGGVWCDWDHGSDAAGDGSFNNPFKTIGKGVATGKKLVIAKADADGTIYQEVVSVQAALNGLVITGWGPQRPVLEGGLYIVHCYDCSFKNLELRYPPEGSYDPMPQGTLYGVHNYRNMFSNIKFTAPHGLPSGARLATCHHAYDNLFVDIEADNLQLRPVEGGASFVLFNYSDHGSGTQFIRVRLGSDIKLAGPAPASLSLTFISIGGYCGTFPTGVSAVRNCLAGNIDLTGMAAATEFRGAQFSCYYYQDKVGGDMIANNTFAHITASQVRGIDISSSAPMGPQVTGNILGPFYATQSAEGVRASVPVSVTWSNIFEVASPAVNSATLGAGTINANPLFVGGGDFHLAPGSPCVNSSTPGWLDPDGSAADMGCYGGPTAK